MSSESLHKHPHSVHKIQGLSSSGGICRSTATGSVQESTATARESVTRCTGKRKFDSREPEGDNKSGLHFDFPGFYTGVNPTEGITNKTFHRDLLLDLEDLDGEEVQLLTFPHFAIQRLPTFQSAYLLLGLRIRVVRVGATTILA
jgi:hypothetical protein